MENWLPQLTSIEDPIADDFWSYERDDGVQYVARVTIGRPEPVPADPGGHWYCPLLIAHNRGPAAKILCMVGVGPVDALINAGRVARDHFHELRKVSPRARPVIKKQAVTVEGINEAGLQAAFTNWGTDRAGLHVAGAPAWLLKRGQPKTSRSFRIGPSVSMEFRPDVVLDDEDATFVAELKSAQKGEPLAVAQALLEAFVLGRDPKAHGLRHKPVPVIITQFNYWNRGALSFLLEKGFRWGREFYLEVDVVKLGSRKWLWFDVPLAPVTPVLKPPASADNETGLKFWYRISSCEAWFGTETKLEERDGLWLRPEIPEHRYALCAAVQGRPNEWLLWSGEPDEKGDCFLLESGA
jgi:hypothetical protein